MRLCGGNMRFLHSYSSRAEHLIFNQVIPVQLWVGVPYALLAQLVEAHALGAC